MCHGMIWRACGLLATSFLIALAAVLPSSAVAADGTCRLAGPSGPVSHVIYLQFDNVHFRRDDPNVPSDLEQMPHLLRFLESGTLLTNQHTPLVSHTADDLITSLTGLYGDRHGMPLANEYQVYGPTGASSPAGSFAYWTDPIVQYDSVPITDKLPTLVTPGGGNPPAPWVPYTRAGCNFGSVATANTILENTAVDVPTVFGPNSPQAKEAKNNQIKASADFVGIGIHCAQNNATCSAANQGEPDLLPNEPRGYNGYMGLFGHKY